MAMNPAEMPYPTGIQAQLARFPIVLYRMGLGAIISKRVMILSTRGRKTGLLRHTPVGYMRDGDVFYAISGWAKKSDWYKNLQANPNATLQIGNWRFAVKAEILETAEEIEAMLEAAKQSGNESFAQIAEQIAEGEPTKLNAVRFVPTGYPPEGDIPTDLGWILWVMGGLLTLLVLSRLFGGGKDKGDGDKEKKEKAKPKKPEKQKPGGFRSVVKFAKVIPALAMIYRKISSAKAREEGMKTRDWLEIAPMFVSLARSLAD